MLFLRQATSATVMLGPYVGSDGAAITGITLTQSAIMLSKNGTAFVAKNETTNGSHRIIGYYSAMFNDTDTGSLGRLQIASSAAAALPVWHEYTVMASSIYDAMILGSTVQFVDLVAGAVDSASIAVSGLQNMSNILATDMSSLSASIAARSPVNALRSLRNRVTTSGTIMSVYAENDSTAVWTANLTANTSASLIVEMDPA